MEGSAKGPVLCCWVVVVILFVIVSCNVPPLLYGATKLVIYIPMFILICPILVVRMSAFDKPDPAIMCAQFCCVLIPSMIGCALTLFGAGEYYSLAHGAEGTSSIASVRDLLSAQPRPTKFYFNDGYIARTLTTSETFCQKNNKGHTVCSTFALAPVYQNGSESFEGTTIYAWALPVNQAGRIIPGDTCQHESGAQGLCGTMPMMTDSSYFDQLVEKFKKEHVKLKFSEDLPYILFTDPAEVESLYKGSMTAGMVFLCVPMAITVFEAIVAFREAGGFERSSIAREGDQELGDESE